MSTFIQNLFDKIKRRFIYKVKTNIVEFPYKPLSPSPSIIIPSTIPVPPLPPSFTPPSYSPRFNIFEQIYQKKSLPRTLQPLQYYINPMTMITLCTVLGTYRKIN
jgi:hypothetical protein